MSDQPAYAERLEEFVRGRLGFDDLKTELGQILSALPDSVPGFHRHLDGLLDSGRLNLHLYGVLRQIQPGDAPTPKRPVGQALGGLGDLVAGAGPARTISGPPSSPESLPRIDLESRQAAARTTRWGTGDTGPDDTGGGEADIAIRQGPPPVEAGAAMSAVAEDEPDEEEDATVPRWQSPDVPAPSRARGELLPPLDSLRREPEPPDLRPDPLPPMTLGGAGERPVLSAGDAGDSEALKDLADTERRADDAVLGDYLGGFKSLRDGGPKSPGRGKNDELDNLLETWRGLRFRTEARKLAEGGGAGPVSSLAEVPAEEKGGRQRQPGTIIKDRFILEETIGQGGMGEVFKAVDRRKLEARNTDPFVALKILSESFRKHPDALKTLEQEARKSQALSHPNIINVFDFDRDGPHVFMVMELLNGQPLNKVVRDLHGNGLSLAEAWPMIEAMGAALAHAHKNNVVHSDFKPSNVFRLDSGTVKVLDFGIARAAANVGSSSFDVGTVGGLTPSFASPEMLRGEEPDPRDDIYALACVTYELLAGRHPFRRRPADQAEEEGLVPPPIPGLKGRSWRTLQRGLAFSRSARIATVEEFVAGMRPISRRAVLMGIAAAAAILLLAVVSFFGGEEVAEYEERHASAPEQAVPEVGSEPEAPAVPPGVPAQSGSAESAGTPAAGDPHLDEIDAESAARQLAKAATGKKPSKTAEQSILAHYNDLISREIGPAVDNLDFSRIDQSMSALEAAFPDNHEVTHLSDLVLQAKILAVRAALQGRGPSDPERMNAILSEIKKLAPDAYAGLAGEVAGTTGSASSAAGVPPDQRHLDPR